MAKAVGAWPRPGGVAKTLWAWRSPWGSGQGFGGVAKAVGVWSRPWGCGQGLGGVAEALGA